MEFLFTSSNPVLLLVSLSAVEGISVIWQKDKDLPYEQAIAAHGTTMAGIPSQVVYRGCSKIPHDIPPWPPFNNTGATLITNSFPLP